MSARSSLRSFSSAEFVKEDDCSVLSIHDAQSVDSDCDVATMTPDANTQSVSLGQFQLEQPMLLQPPPQPTSPHAPPAASARPVGLFPAKPPAPKAATPPSEVDLEELTRFCFQASRERDGQFLCPYTTILIIAAHAVVLAKNDRTCPHLVRAFKGLRPHRRSGLVVNLVPQLLSLSGDRCAFVMVQCILAESDAAVLMRYVIQSFAGHLASMSCDMYANNVVQKVITLFEKDAVVNRMLMDELVFDRRAAHRLVHDIFGSFVMRCVVWAVTTQAEMHLLNRALAPFVTTSRFKAGIEQSIAWRSGELEAPTPTQWQVPMSERPLAQYTLVSDGTAAVTARANAHNTSVLPGSWSDPRGLAPRIIVPYNPSGVNQHCANSSLVSEVVVFKVPAAPRQQ